MAQEEVLRRVYFPTEYITQYEIGDDIDDKYCPV